MVVMRRLVRLVKDLACWAFFTALLAIVIVPACAIAFVCWLCDEDDFRTEVSRGSTQASRQARSAARQR